jgi:Xaa-Pro dipeptidase
VSGDDAGLTFSPEERARRRAVLDAAMEAAGVDHVLVYAANRAGSAVQWLTGWPVTREAVVVHSPGVPDALLVQFYNHVPQARVLAADADVRWAGPRPVEEVVAELTPRSGGRSLRVGVIGPVPVAYHLALGARAIDVVDLDPVYTRIRMTKSAEEVERLRVAARMTDAGCAAMRDGAGPGSTDHDLVALVEGGYVRSGGGHYLHYFAMTAMDSPTEAVPAQWPTGRVLRAGDVLTCELSASWGIDYPGQLLRTFTVAAEPTGLYRALHDVADEALARIEERLRPGVTAAELVEAAGVIEEAGFTTLDDLVHGLGGGYLPPVLGSRSRTLQPVPDVTLVEGMTLVVQPNVTTLDGSAGVQTGELLHVTAGGCERLHGFPRGLGRIA